MTNAPAAEASAEPMTHRQIMEALSGILLGLFVAILSSTIVSNALPRIISDLHGSQTSYTWVVTATLLAMTATTPIWGKLADLTSKKLLVQLALVIYVAGSALAGLSQNTSMLIGCRVIQGIGVGGLTALAQVVMAAMISPRERGRYSGYLGATFALATVGGPLIGGVIVDTPWLGWRWCFYVGVPFAVLALVILQKTLKLPVVKREVSIDYLGATLISAGVSLLLVWVSLAGRNYDWVSWQTAAMVIGAFALLGLAVRVESRATEPIIPLWLFKERTIVLAVIGSLAVGLAMMSASVFLSQYFQIARGKSPTVSGLMTLPMIGGLVIASTVIGKLITATGLWKRYLVGGAVSLMIGLCLMGTARADTNLWVLGVYMFLVGVGVGALQQNLVLAVQNAVPMHQLGAASSVVAFFRSLGGAVGVSALGAVMATKVTGYLSDGGLHAGAGGGAGIPNVRELQEPARGIVEGAYGHSVGDIFLFAAPFGLIALIAVLLIKEVPLQSNQAVVVAKADPTGDDTGDAAGSVDGADAAKGTAGTRLDKAEARTR
ncbi:MDR family MFS transporter [Streptomyces sp. SID3343]|uniref:MDR family MFS transporter n=1 Tax=Streptomyces sp. SID3343 TaxID=2690260 RepID=UPI001368442A|nr:MDR family MFS transporter [Streptomyces sp. SID3343]MYW03530.1 MFS transporter [Streptomyces sp. SID3343]